MKKLTQIMIALFVSAGFAMGCASEGDKKEEENPATESAREIQPAASGGMQRMEEEEAPAEVEEPTAAETEVAEEPEAPALAE